MTRSSLSKIVLNFLSIYLIWGSTYLAIKYALPSFPPFLLAGLRFITGSLVLFVVARGYREPWLAARDLKIAAVSGVLLSLGNALVCYAEESFSSGLVALIVGTMPAWIMLLNWRFFAGARPRPLQLLGVGVALGGVAVLTHGQSAQSGVAHWPAWLAMAISVTSWASGTLIQRTAEAKNALFTFVSVQIGIGGIAMLVLWPWIDGPASFHPELVTLRAVLSIGYLAIFGSVVAFTSYLWLNRRVEPALVSTYALVNPVVAVWLGSLFLGETLTGGTLLASFVVITGLTLILRKKPLTSPRSAGRDGLI